MKKYAAILVAVMGMAVMGCEPNQAICNDAPKYEEAISQVQGQDPGFKADLLDDVAEYAASPGYCPGYEGQADSD